jgi:hypothetical protein
MKQFNALLQHPTMQAYAKHTQTTDVLAQMWHGVVPEALIKLTVPTQIRNNRLIVVCTSNAIAAKIKLLTPSLLIQLQNQGYELTAIQPKVQVKSSPEVTAKPSRQLSLEAARALKKLEAKLPNTALGEALAKIARNASR